MENQEESPFVKFEKSTFSALRKWVSVRNWLETIGETCIEFLTEAGALAMLCWRTNVSLFTRPIRIREVLNQMFKIGVASLPLVSLTSLFTGMVLALQSAYQLQNFGATQFTADLVSLSTVRELGPVLTALVVSGRVGASIAAEIGTMKVTEQIDALQSLATDPIDYLVVPRYLAAILMLVILTIYADVVGVLGGYAIAIFKLKISSYQYLHRAIDILQLKDVFSGLAKAFFFGMIIAIDGCYYGFIAKGGAEGVGQATTRAVVTALISVIAFDCFFTALVQFAF